MESVQKTVELADNALEAIHEITKGPSGNAENDDLSHLTQSIVNTIIGGSNENIGLGMEGIEEETKSTNQFKTAAELHYSNINQKQNNSGYNSAGSSRKLLGAKRRAFDRKSNESGGGYRDEGRDINTEFR